MPSIIHEDGGPAIAILDCAVTYALRRAGGTLEANRVTFWVPASSKGITTGQFYTLLLDDGTTYRILLQDARALLDEPDRLQCRSVVDDDSNG
jgi:hypothetical protein